MGDTELTINLLIREKSPQRGEKVEKQASVLNLIHNASKLKIILFQLFYKTIYLKDFHKQNVS